MLPCGTDIKSNTSSETVGEKGWFMKQLQTFDSGDHRFTGIGGLTGSGRVHRGNSGRITGKFIDLLSAR